MTTELLTVSQTAKYLQLSEKTVRRLIGNGSLQASKLSDRSWRIRVCDLDAYVSANLNCSASITPAKIIISHDFNTSPRLISLFSGCGGMD